MNLLIINGPNLGRLDIRDSAVYGDFSYEELKKSVEGAAREAGFVVDMRQSDDEAIIISWLHEAADKKCPVIINPAAFTHYSIAIRDAVELIKAPVIEVHLSNPMAREEFRHTSYVAGVVHGTIAGFGPDSYLLAITAMKRLTSR